MEQKWGPPNGPLFFPVARSQAAGVWQWWRFLRSQIPPGNVPLLLNLDETCVKFYYEPTKGLRFSRKAQQVTQQGQYKRNVSLGQQRKALTLVGIVCNDAALQPHMPQFVLMAERNMSKAAYNEAASRLPKNIYLLRKKSAWVCTETFAMLLGVLGKILAKVAPDRQPVLLMDALGIHFALKPLRKAKEHNIWCIILPAACTSLLQVLDTDVFARFKLFFRRQLMMMMMEGANDDLNSKRIIEAVVITIRHVLQGHCWNRAFEKNGFGSRDGIRHSLMAA